MINIIHRSPGLLWKAAVQEVFSRGESVKDGDKKLKELLNVYITCLNPNQDDEVLQKHADQKMVDWMLGNFLKQEPVLNWGYSYGKRFFNSQGVNQVDNVISKLRKNPDSKSATINLMDAKEDLGHVPCICAIDFKIRNGKLNSTAFFRSQDAGKKLYADIISIGKIMEMVAIGVGVETGELSILIASLHIYEEDIAERVLPLID